LNLLPNFSGNRLSKDELEQKFGDSKEIMKTVHDALEGKTYLPNHTNISMAIDIAAQVASCGYEHGTGWGKYVNQLSLRAILKLIFPFVWPILS